MDTVYIEKIFHKSDRAVTVIVKHDEKEKLAWIHFHLSFFQVYDEDNAKLLMTVDAEDFFSCFKPLKENMFYTHQVLPFETIRQAVVFCQSIINIGIEHFIRAATEEEAQEWFS